MRKLIPAFVIITLLSCTVAEAQVRVFVTPGRPGYGYRMYRQRAAPRRHNDQNLPKFEPSVNISIGYGFPNLDQLELPEFYRTYKGNITQTGPFNGSLDYQFSRGMSIGVMASHGTVSVPYYNYGNPYTPAVTGSLDNWAVMLNFMRYMPVSAKVTPYLRAAIGINTWKQNYTDSSGYKVNYNYTPSQLAYQVGIGSKFYLSNNTGIFLEAGYGKYILNGGLTVKL